MLDEVAKDARISEEYELTETPQIIPPGMYGEYCRFFLGYCYKNINFHE